MFKQTITNYLFPKTNNLHYIAAFTAAIFFATKFFLDSFPDLIGVIILIDIVIALFALLAFENPKTREREEHADAARMSLMGMIVAAFSFEPAVASLESLAKEPYIFYVILRTFAWLNLARAVFWLWQFAFVRDIRNRRIFGDASAFKRFFDMLARLYDQAYDGTTPTVLGAATVVVATLVISGIVSIVSIESQFQPLVSLTAMSILIHTFQRKLPYPVVKN